jgi:hypothetical protein
MMQKVNNKTEITDSISATPLTTITSNTIAINKQFIITQTKQNLTNNIVNYFENLSEPSAIKIGLPYPQNLRIEKRSDSSFIVTWEPPTAPISNQSIDNDNLSVPASFHDSSEIIIQSYKVYLNHEIYSVINAEEDLMVLVENVDLSVVRAFFLNYV